MPHARTPDITLADIKSAPPLADSNSMSEEHAVRLDFDATGPFGDATFLGRAITNTRVFDTPVSPLGTVSALSNRGVRIDHQGDACLAVGDQLTLTLIHHDTRLDLPARVGHVIERGFRHYTFGLVFDDLADPQRDALVRLLAVDHHQLQVA